MVYEFNRDGFAVAQGVLSPKTIEEMQTEFERLAPEFASTRNGTAFGMRGLMSKSAAVRKLANSVVLHQLVTPYLGENAQPVRTIFFDKTPSANWPLPWHQDRVIAVSAHHEIDGYDKWTLKDGVDHVEPPAEILKQIVTIRLHLDDCDETNGALKVMAGWHDSVKPSAALAALRQSDNIQTLSLKAGDAVLMRPLTPHSSDKSISERRRRVLHIEYCGVDLPSPLTWKEAT